MKNSQIIKIHKKALYKNINLWKKNNHKMIYLSYKKITKVLLVKMQNLIKKSNN